VESPPGGAAGGAQALGHIVSRGFVPRPGASRALRSLHAGSGAVVEGDGRDRSTTILWRPAVAVNGPAPIIHGLADTSAADTTGDDCNHAATYRPEPQGGSAQRTCWPGTIPRPFEDRPSRCRRSGCARPSCSGSAGQPEDMEQRPCDSGPPGPGLAGRTDDLGVPQAAAIAGRYIATSGAAGPFLPVTAAPPTRSIWPRNTCPARPIAAPTRRSRSPPIPAVTPPGTTSASMRSLPGSGNPSEGGFLVLYSSSGQSPTCWPRPRPPGTGVA
jgi:hypothetical protein